MAECICLVCGYEGRPHKTKRGTKTMEMMIWTILLVPGPIYSLWRRVGLPKQCPNCKQFKMVGIHSDQGLIKQRQIDMELGLIAPRTKEQPVVLSDKSHSDFAANDIPRKRDIDPDAW